MKTHQPLLFNLIKSMTPDECLTFEAKEFDPNKVTSKSEVWRIYRKNNSFEESEVLIHKLKIKNIDTVKSQLKRTVTDFLISIQPASGFSELRYKYAQMEMLYSRQLYKETANMCDTAEELATKLDLHWAKIPINHFRYKLLNAANNKNIDKEIDKIRNSNKKLLQQITFNFDVNGFQEEVIGYINKNLNHKSKNWLKKISEFEQHEYLKIKDNDTRLSFYTILGLGTTKVAISQAKGNFSDSYFYAKGIWDYLQKDWDFYLKYKRFEVLTMIYNLMSAMIYTENKKVIKTHLQEIEKLIDDKIIFEEYIIVAFYHNKLKYIYKFEPTKLPSEIYFHEKNLMIGLKKCPLNIKKMYIAMIAISFMKLKQFEKVKEYTSLIFNKGTFADNRADIDIDMKLLYFMAFFSQIISEKFDNKMFLEYKNELKQFYDAVRRSDYFKDRNKDKIIIELLMSLKKEHSTKNIIELITLTQIKLKNTKSINFNNLIDASNWLEDCMLLLTSCNK